MVRMLSRLAVAAGLALAVLAGPAAAQPAPEDADPNLPLFTKNGAPLCDTRPDLAIFVRAAFSGHRDALAGVEGCSALRDGLAVILIERVELPAFDIARVRVIEPRTKGQIEGWTVYPFLRNGAAVPAPAARRPRT